MRRNGPCGLLAALLSGAGIVAAGEPITSPPKHEAAALPGLCSVAQPDCCQPDAKGPTWWFNAEYLLWRTKNHPLPVPVLSTGNLNDPDSAVLLGLGNPLNPHPRHGARFTAGLYLDCEQRLGIEGSYFFLGKRTDSREVNSSGFGNSFDTGNPFAVIDDAGVTSEAFLTLANPGLFSSSTRLDLSNFLQGYEVNGLYSLASTGNVRVSLLGGFRYVDLEEHLTLGTFSPAVPPTTTNDFQIVDEFDARNQFYGGQLGARFEWTAGRFFVNGTGKVAVGTMLQEINTHGFFRQTLPAVVIDSPSGLYAQPSNSGRHTRNEFAWIPEGNLNVGAKLTENVRSSVGYTFLWMSDVVRPGDQIDRVINTSQAAPVLGGNGSLVGPARPAVPFNDTTFWAQGLNIGLEIRY